MKIKQYIKIFCTLLCFYFVLPNNLFANNSNELLFIDTPITQSIVMKKRNTGTKVVNRYRKQKKYKETIQKIDVADTNNSNKITKIWESPSGILNVTAKLIDTNIVIDINAYNMLGKKVAEVFSGKPINKNGDGEYYFVSDNTTNLPKGVYVLVIQSNKFRVAEKFVLTKN